MCHQFFYRPDDLLLSVLTNLGGNPDQHQRELQKTQSNIALEQYDFLIKNMFPHVVVESLAVVKHDFFLVGVDWWNHFADDFQKLDWSKQLWTNLCFKYYSQKANDR